MNKTSRPLIVTLAVVLAIAVAAVGLAYTHESGGINGSLMFMDHDLSDSALGWAIAIPVLLLVAVIVAAVLAGATLVTVVALIFAAIITVLALLLAMAPVVVLMAIPLLALYGFIKLVPRNFGLAA